VGKQSLFAVRTVRNTQIQSVPHRRHVTSPLQSPTNSALGGQSAKSNMLKRVVSIVTTGLIYMLSCQLAHGLTPIPSATWTQNSDMKSARILCGIFRSPLPQTQFVTAVSMKNAILWDVVRTGVSRPSSGISSQRASVASYC
jgi:hypothetical protein